MECKLCGSYVNNGLMFKTYKWVICEYCYDDLEEVEIEEGEIVNVDD